MKQLVVLSGKGGTGKTSITGAFAALARNTVVADCDVDAADLHLILEPEILDRHDFIAGKKAEIIRENCTRCGACYESCEFDAIIKDESAQEDALPVYTVDPLSCEGCAVCSYVCLDQAVTMKTVVSGEWFRSDTRFGPMVHGRLGVAEANSGKLVTLLCTEARRIAEDRKGDMVIVDGPPGIGCPVIASLTGADYVLLVTEPTLPALHDLERIAELIRHFKLRAGIAINKWDINASLAERIAEFAEREGFEILGRIPYDIVMTQAQVAAKTIIEFTDGAVAEQVRTLWTNVRRRLDDIDVSKPKQVPVKPNNPNSFGV